MGKHLTVILIMHIFWNCTWTHIKGQALPLQFTDTCYNATIYENSAAKTYVESPIKMGIYITDPSWDIRYQIESGDCENLFKAEEDVLGDFSFLRIRTKGGRSSILNREVKEHYLLTVKAFERLTGAGAQTRVEVHVLDINDLQPLFSPTSYSISVPESTAIRTSIGRVTATDADVGTNGEYYFSFKEWTDVFSIHPTSGVITLAGRLDHSQTRLYDMDVLAVDRGMKLYGNSGISSMAKLAVRVQQANEHVPVITAVPLTPWYTPRDPTYALVSVEDDDHGLNGEIASLSIVAGDPLQQFKVIRTSPGSKDYKIKAIKEVEWEGYGFGYNLTLQAKDKGSPPKFSSATVVWVRSPHLYMEPPKFEKSIYKVNLSEFAPVHTSVVMVRVRPTNPQLKYSLQSKMHQRRIPFTVNPTTGLIMTTEPFQADRVSKYEFDVITNDRQASAKVVIDVIDMNNNAPKFHQASYVASVDEQVPIGTSVLMVSASDLDDGENGYVTYSIANVNPQPFIVDYFTGVVSTADDLDYELMPSTHNLRIRASDWGSPFRREAEAVVSITLNNLNDNEPMFESVDCDVTVPRSLSVGEQVTVVSAIDADDLDVVQYEIKAGNSMGCFALDTNSGVLSLKMPLNDAEAEQCSLHTLQIIASDGENSSPPMFLNITVVTALNQIHRKCVETGVVNNLAPMFLFGSNLHNQKESLDTFADIYSVNLHVPQFMDSTPSLLEVKEDVPVGTGIALLRVTDADSGFNGKLLFVISGGDFESCFTIDMDTGWLKIYEPLDRETTDHYTLNITVYDLGLPQKSSSHVLKINVLDANDNSPKFQQSDYSVEISENTAVGTDIIQVEATDKDFGVNGMVRYMFLTETDQFLISEETGIVSVKSLLDREANPLFILKVAARDEATDEPQMISTVLLKIVLEDVNDNPPRFLPPHYHVKVREDLPVGTVVLWLEAHDPDLGHSGQVRYSLADDGDGRFLVDKISGAVRISQALDFEKRQVYNMTARAKDRGKPSSLSSTCYVEVEIVDVNENLFRPSFPSFTSKGSVSEDAPVGTAVMRVMALDEDKGSDGEVRYSIRDGSGLGVFTIQEESGVIRTQELLDHETTVHYWLTVYATDQGVVPLSSFVEVYIEVQDVNDNAPQTSEPVYYPSVSENSPKDVSVIQIEAFDPDAGTSDELSYRITSGNPQGFFTINPKTGLVTTTSRKLDREQQDEHFLEITVTDHGSPAKSSIVRVIVRVEDENDSPPQFLEKVYKIKLPERREAAKREPIYRVIASDRDESPYSEISYSIEEGDEQGKFFIQPKTGLVSSREAFSAGEYDILTIKVVNSGRPQQASTCRLHVEWIPKPPLSSKALVFEETSLSFSVMESDPVAHMVGVITTEPIDSAVWFDIKGDIHAKEAFHIVQMACDLNCTAEGGNVDSRFDVEKGSGMIIIARPLDAEQKSNYNLTLEATDGTRSISVQVLIQVIDTNEHRPQFSKPKYEISIPEEAQPGMKILEISATDKDKKNKLSYTLLSSTDPLSLKKFRLDPGTGILYTTEKLDHETKHRHTLTVMVRDQDVPVKQNLVRVIVNVEDTNDNTPWFTSSQYSGRVFESAAVGSAVLQVTALDKDKGKNAEIHYSIESGDDANTFGIDSLLGIITVAKELDCSSSSQFTLAVKASDKGDPPLSVVATVNIAVTISDNTKPKFPQSEILAEISEAAPVGSFVSSVTAFSQSSVSYQIKDGNVNNAFDINPNSGVVVTRRMLDYESLSSYQLTVQGMNMAGMASNITVLIHLHDENDNAPVFTQARFVGIVSESATVKSMVLTVDNSPLVIRATDVDEDSNARVVYQIVEPFAHNYFAIDSGTGAIQTISSLDHELRSVFHFTVQVHDTGMPRLFAEKSANVTIQVTDANDCPPKFSQDLYETSLMAPTYKGVKALSVNATDEDSPPNAKLIFSILDGNIGDKFRIDPISGEILVWNATQLRSRYRLVVRVSDGRFASTAVVKVTLSDNKDHDLKFTQETYTASVKENLSERQTLVIVAAVGSKINEPLSYTILNPDSRFEIGPTSGVLFASGIPFDCEEQDTFDIVVEVTKEQRSSGVAHVLVKVTVEDMNDNAPVFLNLPYYALVQIDAAVGQVIRQVTAVDRDSGKNSEIKYHLNEHNKYFHISPSGVISLKKSFEPTSLNTKFVLSIVAQDEGEPALSSTVEVPIMVVNKAVPLFEKPFYKIEIPENVQVHTSIVQVQANDAGPRSVYSIFEGDSFSQFSINFNSGVIDVIQPLDYETHPAYKLNIRATDSLTGSHSDVFVDIILEDVNDNAPAFEMKSYNASLSESTVIGISVLKVIAMDTDSGNNKVLFYQLLEEGGTVSDYFGIDRDSGIISTASLLDHEAIPQHKLMVRVVDGGAPALSSEVQVIIYVKDLNDNPPVFTQRLYSATVSELASQGHFVTRVQASDADSSDADKLRYSFLSGNEDNSFAIDGNSGIILISNRRKWKMEPLYSLILSVTDGVFRSSAEVQVTVICTNLHSPYFSQAEYLIELLENSPIGTLVMEVKAADQDPGIYGQVTYSILNDVARDKFTLNAEGQIYTAESFDREKSTEKLIPISIMAKDGGGRVGFCTVNVILTDINDCTPQFRVSEYRATIPWDVPRGTTVIKTTAVDLDEGSNADIVYAIDSNVRHFEIHPLSGVIVTKDSLIGFGNELYTFYVTAKDSGSPPRQSVIPVYVRILPTDMPRPAFVELLLRIEMAEDLPVGTEIDVIQAESKLSVIYSLVKGNILETNRDDVFVTEGSTGKLKLAKRLDHEATQFYQLTLQAQSNQDGMELVSTIEVSIQLKDVNDNHPKFDSDAYESFIVENLPGGTSVIQVRATDLDSGLNGQVTYHLDKNQDCAEALELFAVNSKTGWITTLREIDREKRDRYRLAVLATDKGQEVQMVGSTTVEVTVLDVNDNPPRFTAVVFRGSVREDNSMPGEVIVVLSSSDADSEEINRIYNCYITGGDPLGQFGIEYIGSEWAVTARKPLNREEKDRYLLNITATDGTFVAKAAVEVTVLDVNDNSPVCEKGLYAGSIPEDAPAGKLILQVSATDADVHSNAEISYQLFGSGAESFSMDSFTGALKTLLPLNREERREYSLTVRAVDGGHRYCQADILITVDDVNDNAPQFPSDSYHISVPENTEPGTYVARLQATDIDSGTNSKILYSLERSAGGLFSIQEKSGIITLERPLGREAQAVFTLRARATDQGSPRRLSSVCSVVVTALEVSDRPPVFERRDYVATVPEDVTTGTRLLRVFAAASGDAGAGAEITYSITDGNERGTFSVNSRTGDVFVIERLDYETSREHYLTVKATAGGEVSPSDVATVTVNLTDVNDNSPVFSQEVYTAVVSEEARPGKAVLTVLADDIDGPCNNRIHFSIVNGNQGSPFIIDALSGDVKVTRPLDREQMSEYSLTVLASDSGNPPKSSSAAINIAVSDVNDNPPIFAQANYSLFIQESLPAGTSVLQLRATDRDAPHNGPPFSYAILEGNEGHLFEIDPQGTLTTAAKLRRKVKEHYALHIQVADSGRPPLHSSTVISVSVVEASVSPPSVLPLHIFVSTLGDEYAGGFLGWIHASPPEAASAPLAYSLQPEARALFSVSRADGRLLTCGRLDAGLYAFNVTVDDGRVAAVTAVTVRIRQVTRRMLDVSVIVRFAEVTPEEFVGDHWQNFQTAIGNMAGVHSNDVQLVSLQPAELPGGLDVLLYLERSEVSRSWSREVTAHKLNSSTAAIQQLTGLHVVRVVKDLCAGMDCPTQHCRERASLDQSTMTTYSTARLSFVTPRHRVSATCLCQDGKCPVLNELCEKNPCPEGSQCVAHPRKGKYSCVCKQRKCPAGPSMAFTENSYIKYRLIANKSKEELKLSLKLRTFSKHGTVMFAKGTGYSVLEVVGGRLQFRFDCGGGPAVVSVHSVQVDDGQWHAVSLAVDGNHAELVLDQVHAASGIAPGAYRTLDLDGRVFLGGRGPHAGPLPSTRPRRSLPVSSGLRGCMDSVLFNGHALSLSSHALSGAIVEETAGVSPGCVMFPAQDCASQPCLNAGSCSPKPNGGYYCKCGVLFMGTHCEVRISPCASNPCLYGGTCIQQSKDFYCQCRGQYSGQRCQIGPYCKDNPCQNGGQCIDSLDGPVCECEPGFKGERCLSDVDECVRTPCLHGGQCVNLHGSFNCSCALGFSGQLCETAGEVRNQLVFTSWNIGLEELVGVAIFLAAIFVLVLLFVAVRKSACRPYKSEPEEDKCRAHAFLQRSYFDAKPSQSLFSDIPPQVPVRPISYTPSAPSDSHNHLETNSAEGSAALRSSAAVCSVAPNLPPCPASRSPSDTDSILKPGWDYDCDEKAVDFDACLIKGDCASYFHDYRGCAPELQSLSSLQSESSDSHESHEACDLQSPRGYHWDTSDWMPSVQALGIQGLKYEFVQSSSPMYINPDIIDADYLAGGFDIESDSPPFPDFPGHVGPTPPLEYSEAFRGLHPPAGSASICSQQQQQHSVIHPQPSSTAQTVHQRSVSGPCEFRACTRSFTKSSGQAGEGTLPLPLHTPTLSRYDASACGEESEPVVGDCESLDEGLPGHLTLPAPGTPRHSGV